VTDLIDTTEMYLRTILELEEEGTVPLRARISERLGHSGPTVSQTVSRMERDGLVIVSGDRHLELTPEGRAKAVRVMRKHRLAERLLADVIKLDWELVHEEACRWEHVMSEDVERRIVPLISRTDESPYGNPIPGLDELGLPENGGFRDGVVDVHRLARTEAAPLVRRVRRMGEPVQLDPELLRQFREVGIVPGAEVALQAVGDYTRVKVEGRDEGLELAPEIAAHIFVDDH
jgi:DtxR family transcriptional regulator, Mn-dependent transcriptional regulator